jgi:hypothetical protein
MAVELLLGNKDLIHRPSHDLESLFYVLVYICTNLEGPNTPRSLSDLITFTSLPMAAWFVPETSFEGLATSKLGIAHTFESRIVGRFSPYFEDIKECVMDLFRAMYPNGPRIQSSLTHDRMIEIFTETLEKLPSPDNFFSEMRDMPVNTNSRRDDSLCIYDNCVFIAEKRRRSRLSGYNNGSSSSTSGFSTPSRQVTPRKKNRVRPY